MPARLPLAMTNAIAFLYSLALLALLTPSMRKKFKLK
jgi:hypothetical protein